MAVTRTLTAKSKGEVVGSIEMNWPENLDEAVAMEEGGADEVFKLYAEAKVIKERAKLYPKAAGKGPRISAKATYEKLVGAGVDPSVATEATGFDPSAEAAA
jgi:hypothetical protein